MKGVFDRNIYLNYNVGINNFLMQFFNNIFNQPFNPYYSVGALLYILSVIYAFINMSVMWGFLTLVVPIIPIIHILFPVIFK